MSEGHFVVRRFDYSLLAIEESRILTVLHMRHVCIHLLLATHMVVPVHIAVVLPSSTMDVVLAFLQELFKTPFFVNDLQATAIYVRFIILPGRCSRNKTYVVPRNLGDKLSEMWMIRYRAQDLDIHEIG